MDLKETGWDDLDGIIWLRIRASGELFWTR
jgi:hypothetical protein